MSTSPSAAEIQTDRREAKKRLGALTLREREVLVVVMLREYVLCRTEADLDG